MTQARLICTEEIYGSALFRLPIGFSEIWSRPGVRPETLELLIEGPFPEQHKDGDEIGVICSIVNGELRWAWEIAGAYHEAPL